MLENDQVNGSTFMAERGKDLSKKSQNLTSKPVFGNRKTRELAQPFSTNSPRYPEKVQSLLRLL